ncbi:MAG TPA: PilZ domain-containing protein [Thermodesulfovibrionales bacterium]|nr:PilZ domain-containing protein [Thermodesulfovibrionales bacterium]
MDNQSGQERRKSERLPFREDIVVDGAKLCTSSDISEGGLFVSSIQIFEPDDVIEVTIPLKGDKVTVKAQIKYSQPGIGVGVMFVELDDEQKARIREFVASISGKSA